MVQQSEPQATGGKWYLTADGGGTKLQCILFDDQLRLRGFGQSGGTNTNFIGREAVRAHMEEAVRACLGDWRGELDTVWATIVGPAELLREVVSSFVPLRRFVPHGEAYAYLLAGALSDRGCVALAGTGSGAAYVGGGTCVHFGGYGSVFGDDGSGWWIGSHGLNAAVRDLEGWGPATGLTERMYRYLRIESREQINQAVYGGERDPRSVAAGFCSQVGAAADAGDAAALRIVREAAELLALQMRGLFLRTGIAADTPVVACGGAWRSTPLLLQYFVEILQEVYPAPVSTALFAPAMHGVAAMLLERGENPLDRLALLSDRFAAYRQRPL